MGRVDAHTHDGFMRRCVELARQARAAGDHPVGALVVRDGEILGEGREAVQALCDVTAHAEIVALREACAAVRQRDLSGCVLYTTVEPCAMCAYAIRLARIRLVVAGTRPAAETAAMDGMALLTDPAALPTRPVVDVLRGVLAGECHALLVGPHGSTSRLR